MNKSFGVIKVTGIADRKKYYTCQCKLGHTFERREDHILEAGDKNICLVCPRKDYVGDVCNGIEVLSFHHSDKHYNNYYRLKCHCGKIFIAPLSSIRSKHTTSCGCIGNKYGELSKDNRYPNWKAMKERALNNKHKHYKAYDKRIKGLKVEPEWIESPKGFYEELGEKPSNLHTVDRIDNNKGYIKGNIRWSTKSEQQRNRETKPGISGHKYIYFEKRRNRWLSYAKVDGEIRGKYLGQFLTIADAVKAQEEHSNTIKQ